MRHMFGGHTTAEELLVNQFVVNHSVESDATFCFDYLIISRKYLQVKNFLICFI